MYLARASHSILFMPGSKARYNRGVILHETCDFLFQVFCLDVDSPRKSSIRGKTFLWAVVHLCSEEQPPVGITNSCVKNHGVEITIFWYGALGSVLGDMPRVHIL